MRIEENIESTKLTMVNMSNIHLKGRMFFSVGKGTRRLKKVERAGMMFNKRMTVVAESRSRAREYNRFL